jgi:hypothetical protein
MGGRCRRVVVVWVWLGVGDLAEPVVAVAARVLGQILLVVALGVEELACRGDLGSDLTEPRRRQLMLVGVAAGCDDIGLFVGVRVDR